MAIRGKQVLKITKGLNLDLAKELIPPDTAAFLKNVISDWNNGVGNTGNNANSQNLTPVVSNVDSAEYFPCIITYTWNFNETVDEFPRNSLSIVVDGLTIVIPNLNWDTLQAIADSLTDLGYGIFYIDGDDVSVASPTHVFGNIVTSTPPDDITVTPTTEQLCADVGNNVCIGSTYDRRLNQFFWHNWNSLGNHNNWVYDGNTNEAIVVQIDPLLNYDLHYLINSSDIVIADVSTSSINVKNIQRLWYWSEGFNQPRKINVDFALAGGYAGLTFQRTPDEYMNRVKYPPLDIDITNTLTNPDTSYFSNYVVNKLFQFGAVYNYLDGERTTRGAISTLAFSVDTTRNFVELSLSAGSSLVKSIDLYFRETNIGDWKRFDTLKRDEIILNTTYPYNSTTNIFLYKFFNNKAYIIVDQETVNQLFDYVPQKSRAQKYVESNVILDGNILEDYDNLRDEEQQTPTIEALYKGLRLGNGTTLTLDIILFFTAAAPGDITIEVHRIDAITAVDTIIDTHTNGLFPPLTYTVTINPININDRVYLHFFGAGTINNLSTVVGTYSNNIYPNWMGYVADFSLQKLINQAAGGGAHITFERVVSDPLLTWNILTSEDIVPAYAVAFPQLKQGGTYKFGFIMYDAAMRSSYVQTSESLNLTIETSQENGLYQNHIILINWNHLVFPDWVYGVHVCRTKNTTIDRSLGMGYLQLTITDIAFVDYNGIEFTAPTANTKSVKFSIQNVITFNTHNFDNTTTVYTWTNGDRVQFIRNGSGSYYSLANYEFIDLALNTDPVAPDVFFLCDYTPDLSNLVTGALVQIYTPTKQDQNDIFYEVGDIILTTGVKGNNQLVDPTTFVKTFDTYPITWKLPYATNAVTDTGATPFEHHSIWTTKVVPSNGEDIGRINVVNQYARQLWYPARIRKSLAYIPNTFINGLSTNRPQDYRDYDRAKGGIEVLEDSGFKLFVLQEDGCFVAMMAKQLITTADGSTQLITAQQFFSDPIQLQGDAGCQNGESFISWNGLMYWVDAKRAVIVQCDWQQVEDIALKGSIKSYAEAKLKTTYYYNQQEFQNQTCCYDVTEMPELITRDVIGVVVNGKYIYANGQSIVTATDLATYLTTLGYGTFTATGASVCIEGSENNFGDVVFYHTATLYTWNLAAETEPISATLTTIVINGDTYSTTDTLTSFQDLVDWLNTLGFGYFYFAATGRPGVIDCENVYGSITINDDATTFTAAISNNLTQRCASFYTAPMVCNVDYWIIPCGLEPKHKQYEVTLFNQNTKRIYTWIIGDDFETGSVTVSIVVDGATQSGVFEISSIEDILDAINSLANDTFTIIENSTTIQGVSSSGSTYGLMGVGVSSDEPQVVIDSSDPQIIQNIKGVATRDVSTHGKRSIDTDWLAHMSACQFAYTDMTPDDVIQWFHRIDPAGDGENILSSEAIARGKTLATVLDGLGNQTYGFDFFSQDFVFYTPLIGATEAVVGLNLASLFIQIMNDSPYLISAIDYTGFYDELNFQVATLAAHGVSVRYFQMCLELGISQTSDIVFSANDVFTVSQTIETYIHLNYPGITIAHDAYIIDDTTLRFPTYNTVMSALVYAIPRQYYHFEEILWEDNWQRVLDFPGFVDRYKLSVFGAKQFVLTQSAVKSQTGVRLKVGEGLLISALNIQVARENIRNNNIIHSMNYYLANRMIGGTGTIYPWMYYAELLDDLMVNDGEISITFNGDQYDDLIQICVKSGATAILYIVNPTETSVTIPSITMDGNPTTIVATGWEAQSVTTSTITAYSASGTSFEARPFSVTKAVIS